MFPSIPVAGAVITAIVAVILAMSAAALLLREHKRLGMLRRAHADLTAAATSLEQSVSTAIITVDAEGLIRGYNPAARFLLGYAEEEIQGHNIFGLVALSADAKQQARDHRGNVYELLAEAQHKDGTLLPVRVRAEPVTCAGQTLIRFLLEDLTRDRQHAQLEAETRLLWPTFDEAGLIIAVVNPAAEIIRLSGAGVNLLHVSDAEVEGRRYWEVFQRPEEWDSARCSFEEAKTRLGPSRLTAEWIGPDQSPVALDWLMLSPAWDERGELAHVVVTAALSSQSDADSRQHSFKTLERVAGRIAGHFENLLSTINGYSELVLHDLSPASPLRKDVEQILAASERASETTRQLLGFSGRRLLSIERLDLHALLRKSPERFRRAHYESPGFVSGNRKAVDEMLTVAADYAASRIPEPLAPELLTRQVTVNERRSTVAGELAPGDYLKLSIPLGKTPEKEALQHALEPFGSPMRGTRHSTVGLALVNGIARSAAAASRFRVRPMRR